MLDRVSNGMLRRLVIQWDDVKAEIERLQSTAEVRPSVGYEVLQPLEVAPGMAEEVAGFKLLPVVFNLPERAYHTSTDLFVVVSGWMSFRRREFAEEDLLLTHGFGTRVGYFLRSASQLKHVYGAHFDFEPSRLAHPIFHGQMESVQELSEEIRASYGVGQPVVDLVHGVLKTVRVPTAQMDVFSLFVQLCADHLVDANAGREELDAFNSLLRKSTFCQGAAFQVARLGAKEAWQCYRARHWYPQQ